MSTPKPELSFEGWALVTLRDPVFSVSDHLDIAAESADAFVGYVRIYNKDEIPVDLTKSERWMMALFQCPYTQVPFLVVPGCSFAGLELLDYEPDYAGPLLPRAEPPKKRWWSKLFN